MDMACGQADPWDKRFWILNLSFFLFRAVIAATLPLSPDEAYYWLWSANIAPAYFDHPPMVAWCIYLTSAVFGDNGLGVRLFAPLTVFALSWLLYRHASARAGGYRAFQLALAFQLVPFFNLGGLIMTPDTPLFLFWVLGIFIFIEMQRKKYAFSVIALGAAVGFGLLSKYSMAIFPLAAFIALLWTGRSKRLPGLVQAMGVALIVFLPVLIWNYEHGWVSFIFQWRRGSSGEGNIFLNLGGFALAQLLLFSPGFFLLFVRAVSRFRDADPVEKYLGAFAVTPLLFFLPFAAFTHSEAGWAALAYPAALLLAWREAIRGGRKGDVLWRRSLVVAGASTALVYAWGFGLFGGNDILDQARDLESESARLFEVLPEGVEDLPVVAENYRIASLWAFYLAAEGERAGVLPLPGQRKSQFDYMRSPDLSRGFIWVAADDVAGPPQIPDSLALDCRYADEAYPEKIPPGRYAFLICERAPLKL